VEFAYGMEGSNCHFGDGVHPLFPTRISGGSSSGSVWAVAGGLVPLASGSDTGGSVRVPAAYNGLYGLRVTPTHPWSKDGCFPLSPSFDTAGWFTRTAKDMELTIDGLFATARTERAPLKGLELLPNYPFIDTGLSTPHRLAVETIQPSTDTEATEAFQALPDLIKAYLVISSSEAMQVHQTWHERRKAQYDPQTWGRIAKGKQWSTDDLNQAVAVKGQVSKQFTTWFQDYDFIVLPAAPVPAPLLGEGTPLREAHLSLTAPASLAGLPVLTLPYFMESGLSGGLQIIVPDLSPRSIAVWKQLLNR
jgi:Asp-tRNA(Asn)/Glu-tRNA(Gln) amidotransferase A subunit family amidase